jgi:hypothetical protein
MRRSNRRLFVLAILAVASNAHAAAPAFQPRLCPVKLDGTRLGADLTPAGSSLRNTVAWEESTHQFHLWVLANNDPAFPASSVLGAYTHATSADGINFSSDDTLHYEIASADWNAFGSSIDPPLDFLRASFDQDSGTWKLFAWTENVGATVGQYNYNTSVNDLGGVAANTYALHQGPLNTPFAGNHVGSFGLVDGHVYLRVDSAPTPGNSGGGLGRFDYTDALPASTAGELNEADLFAGTPYCWGLDPACETSDPRIKAYVHNVGRTLHQADGSLATYYAFRHWDGTRIDKQLWMVESTDNGATWSAPTGVFADASALTLAGSPLAADGNFSHAEAVVGSNLCRAYFSTKDQNGNPVVATATTSSACDALFADGLEGCGGD